MIRGNARSGKCLSGKCLRGTVHRGKVRQGNAPRGTVLEPVFRTCVLERQQYGKDYVYYRYFLTATFSYHMNISSFIKNTELLLSDLFLLMRIQFPN